MTYRAKVAYVAAVNNSEKQNICPKIEQKTWAVLSTEHSFMNTHIQRDTWTAVDRSGTICSDSQRQFFMKTISLDLLSIIWYVVRVLIRKISYRNGVAMKFRNSVSFKISIHRLLNSSSIFEGNNFRNPNGSIANIWRVQALFINIRYWTKKQPVVFSTNAK